MDNPLLCTRSGIWPPTALENIPSTWKLHEYLKTEMAKAQLRFQKAVDACRMPQPNFTLGECAYVKEHYFRTRRPTKKLAKKYLGPYDLIAQVGIHSFTLKLPNTL